VYLVIRVNSDASDIYARSYPKGGNLETELAGMCEDMVLPDEGDLVEYAMCLATDECDARLHMAAPGRRWAIYRANYAAEAS
jgi:hypothetical protein